MSLPLWTPERQLGLYQALGYSWNHEETLKFLLDWQHRYQVVVCPRRASKSYSAAKKALPIVLGRAERKGKPIPTRTWVVGQTYELAEIEFRYLWEDLVRVGPELGWPKPVLSRDSKKGGDLYILTAWGSEVVGKSADKPQSLLGREVDCVIVAESAQISGDVWARYLQPTLATTQGYALFPTTPDAGALWLHELWVKGLEGNEMIGTYTWPVTGNPTYPVQEYEQQKAFYGENHPVFREQYKGEWVFYSGTVYGNDFDPNRTLIDPKPIPWDWRRIRAIDFGYRDPFVCLWFAISPDGILHLYREYYQTGRSMSHHASAIRGLTGDEAILYSVADSSEPQSIADLRLLGVPCLEANRDRRAGRMLVGDYFRSGRLLIHKQACPNTIRELNFYRWDTDKDKEGSKELTIGDDHAMDALRYCIMSRPNPRRSVPISPPGTFASELRKRTRDRVFQSV